MYLSIMKALKYVYSRKWRQWHNLWQKKAIRKDKKDKNL